MVPDFSNDTDLLEAIRQDDEVAFEYLFKRYYPRLMGYAIRFVEDEYTAQDIIQECFMHFWEKRALLSTVSVSSLLFVMVRNGCLNYLKRRALVNQCPIEYLDTSEGEERLYSIDFMLSADERLLYDELREQVNRILSKLPERSREVFLLSRFKGLKNREIAEKLNISTTAVEKHISRSLKLFAEQLKDVSSYDVYIILLSFILFGE